eukprot:7382454-Prymnesium_polylepis.1
MSAPLPAQIILSAPVRLSGLPAMVSVVKVIAVKQSDVSNPAASSDLGEYGVFQRRKAEPSEPSAMMYSFTVGPVVVDSPVSVTYDSGLCGRAMTILPPFMPLCAPPSSSKPRASQPNRPLKARRALSLPFSMFHISFAEPSHGVTGVGKPPLVAVAAGRGERLPAGLATRWAWEGRERRGGGGAARDGGAVGQVVRVLTPRVDHLVLPHRRVGALGEIVAVAVRRNLAVGVDALQVEVAPRLALLGGGVEPGAVHAAVPAPHRAAHVRARRRVRHRAGPVALVPGRGKPTAVAGRAVAADALLVDNVVVVGAAEGHLARGAVDGGLGVHRPHLRVRQPARREDGVGGRQEHATVPEALGRDLLVGNDDGVRRGAEGGAAVEGAVYELVDAVAEHEDERLRVEDCPGERAVGELHDEIRRGGARGGVGAVEGERGREGDGEALVGVKAERGGLARELFAQGRRAGGQGSASGDGR